MAKKSRRKRRKQREQSLQSSNNRSRQVPTTPAPQQVAVPGEPIARPVGRVATATTASTPAPPAAARYPYLAGELKRVGILAAILIAVLIILSRVLP
ncbi:MAG: hypothetical protein J7K77_03770 [Dehalococcoidales bacterium]|nr:hypothetical protein [Dehalococcoidales bacterium]